MTQEEKDTILGRTRREYREAKSDFGAVKKRNAELAGSVKNLLSALEEHPERIHVFKGRPEGRLLLTEVLYTYTPDTAECLTIDRLAAHLEEYTTAQDRIERLRQSLVEQGDDPSQM